MFSLLDTFCCCLMCGCMLSRVWFFVAPWIIACQAPLSLGLSWQEYWSGLPFPPLKNLPNPRLKSMSFAATALKGIFFTTEPPVKPLVLSIYLFILFFSFIISVGSFLVFLTVKLVIYVCIVLWFCWIVLVFSCSLLSFLKTTILNFLLVKLQIFNSFQSVIGKLLYEINNINIKY